MFEVIDFGMPPCGYSLNSVREGEEVSVQFMEFTSSEDGQHFINRLEGFGNDILDRLTSPIQPSQIDHLLAVCFRDGKAKIYINELSAVATICSKGAIKKGDAVAKSHIADVERFEVGAPIPKDAGFIFLFSVGWRKGLVYDFGPLGTDREQRSYDVEESLGQAYLHVLFQERFSITDDEWAALFRAKWFPFVGLQYATIDALVAYIRASWDPDDILDRIGKELKSQLPEIVSNWRTKASFAPHIGILAHAADRFQNDDWVSCTALLYPRIEGILRTHHTILGTNTGPSPSNLTATAVASRIAKGKSLLMPHRFAEYLRDVYFANFNPVSQDIDVSRHSVAHGVASASQFNQKSAVIAVLVVHQLYYFLEKPVVI